MATSRAVLFLGSKDSQASPGSPPRMARSRSETPDAELQSGTVLMRPLKHPVFLAKGDDMITAGAPTGALTLSHANTPSEG